MTETRETVHQIDRDANEETPAVFTFYLSMECKHCDEEIFYGLNVTTIEHNGHAAIPFDMASQTRFDCDNCGAAHYTGDFYVELDEDDS